MQKLDESFLNKQGENDLTLSFMDEFNIIETSQNHKRLGKVLALFLGICSMIPWNSVIVTFDYFQGKFVDYNVFFVMIIPIAIGLTIMSFLIYPLSQKLKIYQRLLLGNYICLIFLPLLPIIAYYQANSFGFTLCMGVMFVYGLAMQCITGGGISFASAFPKDNYTAIYFTGSALSGILCSIIKIVLLSVLGGGEELVNKITIIFFCIGCLFYVITIKFLKVFQQTEFSITHISRIEGNVITNIDKIDQLEMQVIQKCDFMDEGNSTAGSRLTDLNQLSDIGEEDQKFPMKVKAFQSPQSSGFAFFKSVAEQIWPLPLLLVIGQLQTNLMYPGYSISKMNIDGLSAGWKTTSMAFTYTFADVIGRLSTPYLPVNEQTASKLIKFRYLLCFAFILLIQEWVPMHLRYLVYLNLLLFAFTNGWSLTLSIIVGGAKANSEQKETSSAILGVAINIGIIAGMVLALLLI